MDRDLIEGRYEQGLRKLRYCVGCGKDKKLGMVVCWKCFKHRKSPLKDFQGSAYEWLISIGKMGGVID